MQGLRLTLKHGYKKLTLSPNVLWVLNSDITHISGKMYAWFDTSAWADSNKYKDTFDPNVIVG